MNFTSVPEIDIKIVSHTDLITLLNNLKEDGSIRPLILQAISEIVANNLYPESYNNYEFIEGLEKMKEWKLLIKLLRELYKQDKILYEQALELAEGDEEFYPSDLEEWVTLLNYDTLIELLKYDENSKLFPSGLTKVSPDPSIRDMIYDAIPTIVNLYYANEQVRKITGQKIKEKDELRYLILKLDQMHINNREKNDFAMMKRLIEESSKIHPIRDFYKDERYDLFGAIMEHDPSIFLDKSIKLIQKYLELSPNYHWFDFGYVLNSAVKDLTIVERLEYYNKFLIAAINAKSIDSLKKFIRRWDTERNYYANNTNINEIDILVKQAKEIVNQ